MNPIQLLAADADLTETAYSIVPSGHSTSTVN
jgi:hypothetical protein